MQKPESLTSLGGQHRNSNPFPYLSLVGVQLTAGSVSPPELLLQLTGALHVHSIAFLQKAHLSTQVTQILQLPLVCLHQCFKLVHPVRRVPEEEVSKVWEVLGTRTGMFFFFFLI